MSITGRRQHERRTLAKLVEVVVITVLMTAVCFLMSMHWGTSTSKSVDIMD